MLHYFENTFVVLWTTVIDALFDAHMRFEVLRQFSFVRRQIYIRIFTHEYLSNRYQIVGNMNVRIKSSAQPFHNFFPKNDDHLSKHITAS